MEQKIFLSASRTLQAMVQGKIAFEDLKTGLFCLGATRAGSLYPPNGFLGTVAIIAGCPKNKVLQCQRRLKRVLLAADIDGRVVYRRPHANKNYAMLNELLVTNGYKPLPEGSYGDDYFDKTAAELAKAANPELIIAVE